MARARGEKRYINLLRGLNTEASPLDFPVDASVDEKNFKVNATGRRRQRRAGLGQEGTDELGSGESQLLNKAVTTYEWINVAEKNDISWLVTQAGGWLNFVEITATDPAANPKNFSFDLLARKVPNATDLSVQNHRVQMASIKGQLVVVGRFVIPFRLEYDPDTDTLIGDQILISIRDTEGTDDGLGIDNRPGTLSEEHEYNLYNQGWYSQKRIFGGSGNYEDPVNAFNLSEGEFPSNSDIVYIGAKVDGSDDNLFDPKTMKDVSLGNSTAPRGHFVLFEFDQDREFFRNNNQISGATSGIGAPIASSAIRPVL